MDNFIVYDERGGQLHVEAKDEEDAIEKFYQAIENCIGHELEICECFGHKKTLDRSKVIRPVKVVKFINTIKNESCYLN